jgi:hypothetical protein
VAVDLFRKAVRQAREPLRCHAQRQVLPFNITGRNVGGQAAFSGAKRIPISELKVGGFHRVEGRRLQVNESAVRYQKQIKYLASMI